MVIGHTPAQLGDDPIVRLRFAPLAPSAPKAGIQKPREKYKDPPRINLEERGLSTADLRARVALKERESVRPPDPEKLGEKLGNKEAVAGSSKIKYDENRWAKVVTVRTANGDVWHKIPDPRTGVLSDDPYKNPYPWFGRAYDQQGKWIQQVREFRRKASEQALQAKNEKIKGKIQCIKDREAKRVQKETTGTLIRHNPAKRRPVQDKNAKIKQDALAATCAGLISAVAGDATTPPTQSSQQPQVVIDGPVAPPKFVGSFVKQKESDRYSTYRVDNPLLSANKADMQGRDNRVTAYLLLRLADASWSKKRSQDLATEIAIVLEQEDSAIQIERTYREDAQGSTASCWRIQFSVGRSSNQEKGEANASPDPEFLSNLLLSLVVAVRSKGSEVSSEDKSRFSNVVIHQARGLLDMIQEMPILSCAVNAEMQETKRRSRDRSPNKFSSDEDDVRRKIVDLIIQHQAYEDDTLLILLLQFVGHYGRDDMVLQVLKKCVRDFDLGDNFIEVFEKTFLPFEYVGRALYDLINCVRTKEKGNGHLEAFLNQLHALHAESEEAYPYRKQDDIKKYITKFVEYLSLSNKYDETVSNYLRYAEISRIVQQVSKYGDELCGKEFSDEEKAFEEKISKVFMLLEKYYSDRIEDARSYSRMFLLCLQKLIERWSPSEREDIAAIILLGIELIFESGGESCDEEEVTIMTRDYLSEMGLEDDMIKLACGDITSFFADRRRA